MRTMSCVGGHGHVRGGVGVVGGSGGLLGDPSRGSIWKIYFLKKIQKNLLFFLIFFLENKYGIGIIIICV